MTTITHISTRQAPEEAAYGFVARHAAEYLEQEPSGLVQRCGEMLHRDHGMPLRQAALLAMRAVIDRAARGTTAYIDIDASSATAVSVRIPEEHRTVMISIVELMAVVRRAQAVDLVHGVRMAG